MPRDLAESNRNKATFMDGVSNGEVILYYRTPTNAERVAFKGACVFQKGKKVIDQSVEAQLSYGAKILTGIEDGDFTNGGEPISSNENSDHYNPDWKRLILATAGDLVQSLALVAFSGTVLKYEGKEDESSEETGLDLSEIPGLENADKPFSDEAIAEVKAMSGQEEAGTEPPLV